MKLHKVTVRRYADGQVTIKGSIVNVRRCQKSCLEVKDDYEELTKYFISLAEEMDFLKEFI